MVPEASTEPLNGAQPSISNLLANTEALPRNTEATKSSNGAQLSITNLPANTKTVFNTKHRNYLSVMKRTSAINQGIQQHFEKSKHTCNHNQM